MRPSTYGLVTWRCVDLYIYIYSAMRGDYFMPSHPNMFFNPELVLVLSHGCAAYPRSWLGGLLFDSQSVKRKGSTSIRNFIVGVVQPRVACNGGWVLRIVASSCHSHCGLPFLEFPSWKTSHCDWEQLPQLNHCTDDDDDDGIPPWFVQQYSSRTPEELLIWSCFKSSYSMLPHSTPR